MVLSRKPPQIRPSPRMRRFALLALVLDSLAGGALLLGAPLVGGPAPADSRHVSVNGTCLEMVDVDTRHVVAKPVAEALCATS